MRCCKCRAVIVRRAGIPCTLMTLTLSMSRLGKSNASQLPLEQPASNPQAATPFNAGCRGKCVYGSSWAYYSAQVSDRCDGIQKKHIHFQKESKNLLLPTISVLPLSRQSAQPFQPLAMQAEAWRTIPGVSTLVTYYGKMRLYTPIRLKTTALPWCPRYHSAQ